MTLSLSGSPLRRTLPEQLGIIRPTAATIDVELPTAPTETDLPSLSENNVVLQRTKELIIDGFAGVILSGPPGTSKSWYARRLAFSLTKGDSERVRFVQFHPSYQYEDFIESYEPTDAGGFKPKARIFLTICEQAAAFPESMFILVIDELSRCDAVRVFGEALTYLEKSQRNVEFELASGRRVQVPSNLFIVATMNPWDRGVDELDMAFERRFAKIAMDPDVDILEKMLKENGLAELQTKRLLAFFRIVQTHRNTYARIGHAYFSRIGSIAALKRLWDFQLRFHFEKAFRQSPQEFAQLEDSWNGIFKDFLADPVESPAVAVNLAETERTTEPVADPTAPPPAAA